MVELSKHRIPACQSTPGLLATMAAKVKVLFVGSSAELAKL
jgi:hypothetical protein